ncbi:unnamed protein product [Camellia sinensis]
MSHKFQQPLYSHTTSSVATIKEPNRDVRDKGFGRFGVREETTSLWTSSERKVPEEIDFKDFGSSSVPFLFLSSQPLREKRKKKKDRQARDHDSLPSVRRPNIERLVSFSGHHSASDIPKTPVEGAVCAAMIAASGKKWEELEPALLEAEIIAAELRRSEIEELGDTVYGGGIENLSAEPAGGHVEVALHEELPNRVGWIGAFRTMVKPWWCSGSLNGILEGHKDVSMTSVIESEDGSMTKGAYTASAGGKFRPKGKPQSRKESLASIPSTQSVQTVDIAENELLDLVSPSVATSETKNPLKNNEDSVSEVHFSSDCPSVNPLPEHAVTEETLSSDIGVQSDVVASNANGDWHFVTGKSAGQGTSLGNEFSTSSLANNGAEGSLAHSEIPTVYVSDTTSAEEGPHISVVSNSDGGFHIDNRRLHKEGLLLISGRRGGKFQCKPKIQIGRQKPGADTSHPDAVESIPCPQQAQSIPSETEYMNEGSNLAFPSNNIVDFPSLRFDDSTSELPVNEPTTNFMDASHSEASFPGEHPEAAPKIPEKVSSKCRKRKNPVTDDSLENQKDSISDQENEADRSTRLLRKRKNGCELVDESEEEANVDGDFSYECPSGSLVDEYDNDNDNAEYQGEKEPQKRRAPTKYEKSVPQKENPVRKHKKVNEEVEKSTKAPHKKFSHSTRRKRRQVNWHFLRVRIVCQWGHDQCSNYEQRGENIRSSFRQPKLSDKETSMFL